jgi:hypothetical protein
MWNKVKTVILIISTFIMFEVFQYYTGIPLNIMDAMILLISALCLYLLKYLPPFTSQKYKDIDTKLVNNIWCLLGSIVFVAVLILMGIYLVYLGIESPFKLFTGVKGSSHGYSLVLLGSVITMYSCIGIYMLFYQFWRLIKDKIS